MGNQPGAKVCSKCGKVYPATTVYFTPSRDNEVGLRPECRSCRKLQRSVSYREPVEEGVKVCNACGVEKPVGEFYVKRVTSDGRASTCKVCQKEARRVNALKSEGEKPKVRVCYKCNRPFPLTREFFYRNSHNKFGLDYECRECARARAQRWDDDNPVRARERSRRSQENHREENRERNRAWRRENKEYVEKKWEKWREANPDKIRANAKAMRAKRRAAYGSYAAKGVLDQYERQGGYCFYCYEPVAFEDAHADHYVPLALGGRNDAWNIVIACKACNMRKGARPPGEFLRDRQGEDGVLE